MNGRAGGRDRRRHLSRPCLILIVGVAGSGKTTLAKEILRRLWAVYLDNNHIVDAFFPHTRNGRAYEKLRPCFYRALYTIVEENLKRGNSVVLDAPHVKEMQDSGWRRSIKSMAARTNAQLIVIRCRCAERLLRTRLRVRGEKRDRWKLDHWKEFLTEQPIDVPMVFSHLDIDTAEDLSSNVKLALRHITGRTKQCRKQRSRFLNHIREAAARRTGSTLSVNQL